MKQDAIVNAVAIRARALDAVARPPFHTGSTRAPERCLAPHRVRFAALPSGPWIVLFSAGSAKETVRVPDASVFSASSAGLFIDASNDAPYMPVVPAATGTASREVLSSGYGPSGVDVTGYSVGQQTRSHGKCDARALDHAAEVAGEGHGREVDHQDLTMSGVARSMGGCNGVSL
jgi:hypothetical protein